MIRQWLEKPLLNPLHIQKRQQAVGALCDDPLLRANLTEELDKLFDIERLIGRVVYGTANCRDLRAMQTSLARLPAIKALLGEIQNIPLLHELNERIDPLEDICDLIAAAIVEEPPVSVREGGIIRTGFRQEVDEAQREIRWILEHAQPAAPQKS